MRRLPDEHRDAFRAPYGRLHPSIGAMRSVLEGRTILSVGDVVTTGLVAEGLFPTIAVVDGFTARDVPVPQVRIPGARVIHVKNPAGFLTDELGRAIREGLAAPPALIVVEGEEDLAVVPLALAAPDGSILVYGQPGEGVVGSLIDDEQRRRAAALFDLFVEE